jgi:hypothetical protein
MKVLSLAFDLMFFLSLAYLLIGFAGFEPIIVVGLGGLLVPLCFMYRAKSRQPEPRNISTGSGLISFLRRKAIKEITCPECHRTLPADTKICRYCLANVEQQLAVAKPAA